MNKQEAISAMLNGSKVIHSYFQPGEWIRMPNNIQIEMENGCTCYTSEFWSYRTAEAFNEGWEILNETKERNPEIQRRLRPKHNASNPRTKALNKVELNVLYVKRYDSKIGMWRYFSV